MSKKRPLRVAAVAPLILATACATTTGQPEAAPQLTSSGPESTSSSAPASSASSRPADLDLAGLNPCSTIGADVLAELGYRPPALSERPTSPTQVACSFRDLTGVDGTALFFDSGVGYEQYSNPSPSQTVTETEVMGYRAFSVENSSIGGCTVGADVNDSQTVSAARTGPPGGPTAPLCDKAAQFTAAAIATLGKN